jgi:hypothetical protein
MTAITLKDSPMPARKVALITGVTAQDAACLAERFAEQEL